MHTARKLLVWYNENRRDLPWRNTEDPYRIWLSEIILQQTRIVQGLPYYLRFVESFPTVADLAEAPESKVLKLWQGLGYYSRARNLHSAARIIHREYADRFPDNYAGIRSLPGIGDYTAAAIASFAFNQKYPVIDGNVIRFVCRLNGFFEPAPSTALYKKIGEWLDKEIDPIQPGLFNQAIMEFGALACTPSGYICRNDPQNCPFSEECHAFRNSVIETLPVKKKKEALPVWEFHYLFIHDSEHLWVRKRGYDDLWRGMFDFPLWKFFPALQTDTQNKTAGRENGLETNTYGCSEQTTGPLNADNKLSKWREEATEYRKMHDPTPYFTEEPMFLKKYAQTLSHRKLIFYFYSVPIDKKIEKWADGIENCRKVGWDALEHLAVPKTIERFLRDFKLI